MTNMSLKLPEALAARLSAAARERKQTKSALVREVLERFFDKDDPASHGSCLELASDLAGCVEGPGDLSFNESHLAGYGK
jgi:hypothetical protein